MMTLEHATCARIPGAGLPVLARLRRSVGISVILDGEHAWVSWEPGDEVTLRAILPLEGVELFERRGGAWHRAGQRLPVADGPPDVEPIPIARAVIPAPFSVAPPQSKLQPTLPLTLRRDDLARPTTAMHCSLLQLGRWADMVPSVAIGALKGAIRDDQVMVIGDALPSLEGSTRYWGGQLLVPIGFQVRPTLPEATLVEALGQPGRELLRVIPEEVVDGGWRFAVEAIPIEVFRPLTRAGIRLAMVGASTS